jgi:hypothetical protein
LDAGVPGTGVHGDIALVVPGLLTQEEDQGQVVERRLGYRISKLVANDPLSQG